MMSRRTMMQAAVAAGVAGTGSVAAAAAPAAGGNYAILVAVIDAWKAGDVEAVSAHLTDDIVWHYAAAVAPPLVGLPAAKEFLLKFRDSIAEVRWRIFHYAEAGDMLFVEGVDEYTGVKGERAVAPYAGVLRFRDGRISEWRDYFDRGQLEKTRAGEAVPAFVEELIGRQAV